MSLIVTITAAIAAISNASQTRPIELVEAKVMDCGKVVEGVLSKIDARLLSVRPHEDRCTVVVLITKEGERPIKMIYRVPHGQAESIDPARIYYDFD